MDISCKKNISNFAEFIEIKLAEKKNKSIFLNITHHTYVVIDEIQVKIYVKKENNVYEYCISSFFIGDDDSIDLLEKDGFSTLLELLTDIEEVKKTYRLLEHKLLSPNDFEFAKLQRVIYPLNMDNLCSVCYEPTIEYTICKHPICFKCREKCIQSNNSKCPICRETELSKFPDALQYRLHYYIDLS